MQLAITLYGFDDYLNQGELSEKIRTYLNDVCNKVEERFTGDDINMTIGIQDEKGQKVGWWSVLYDGDKQ